MPNPTPVISENFIKTQFPRADDTTEKLAAKQIQVKVFESVYEAIEKLGKDKTPWLRRVITEAAKRELMNGASGTGLDAPIPHRGGGQNETPAIELSPILKELETAFLSGKTLKPTDIKQLLDRLRSLNMS